MLPTEAAHMADTWGGYQHFTPSTETALALFMLDTY